MPSNGFSPSPLLLLGSLMGVLLGTGEVQAQSPFSTLIPSTAQTLYLAQLDDDELDELDELDDDIESELEDDLEDEVDDELEDKVDDLAEDAAEDAMEDDAEDLAEEAAEDQFEDSLDDDAEDLAEELAEEAAEDRLDEDDWDDQSDDLDDLDDDLNDELDRDDLDDRFDEDEQLAEALEERLLDALEDDLDSLIELNTGDIIVRNEMLVLADDTLLQRLNGHPALQLKDRRPLSALGISLGSFEVRGDVPLESLRAELREAYPGLSVDFNHGYELSQDPAANREAPITLSALYRPGASRAAIGMLDGPVNEQHPAFAEARLEQKNFVTQSSEREREHGTAIASLLVGRTSGWQGLAPEAKLYVASVFSEQAQYGSIATTQSLITALDWLVAQSVSVINISLAGPANQTLETALQRVRALGIVPVAAAGNAGPLADPQYPAAYPTVLAVTAIDRDRRLYAYAVRGEHVDFSAYGVNLSAASGDQGFTAVTGTSFAAPVVSALLLRYLADTGSLDAALEALVADTLDLGEPEKDPLFGNGLPGESQLRSFQ